MALPTPFKPQWENSAAGAWKAEAREKGLCWHLPGQNIACPFALSSVPVRNKQENLPPNLARIHELCLERKTHQEKPVKS